MIDRNLTVEETLAVISYNNDAFFLVSMSVVIFCISGISYWALGWAFAHGEDAGHFIGRSQFLLIGMPADKFPAWFFQFVFAATASTIVSGALAERCEFFAYFAYCILLTGFTYPVISHWTWNPEGWLNRGISGVGYKDFAGSGVVHLHGGTSALIGAILLGPRIGRFEHPQQRKLELVGHSVPFAALGGFLLMFGFFAFNGGSQASITASGDGKIVARAMTNTMLCGAWATITVLLLNRLSKHKKWSLLVSINAVLTGMFFYLFAFNGGSQATITASGDGKIVVRTMTNTMLCSAWATITVLLLNRLSKHKKWSLLISINAVLTGAFFYLFAFNGGSQASIAASGDGKIVARAMTNTMLCSGAASIVLDSRCISTGMVSACAGCDELEPWSTPFVGVGAGLAYLLVASLVEMAKIDDPVQAVAVHAGGGLWGLLITPVFMNGGVILGPDRVTGAIRLGVNVVGAMAIVAWSLVLMGALFTALRVFKKFRVSPEVEWKGLDMKKHGEPAYPLAAYGHGWVEIESDCAFTFPVSNNNGSRDSKRAPNKSLAEIDAGNPVPVSPDFQLPKQFESAEMQVMHHRNPQIYPVP